MKRITAKPKLTFKQSIFLLLVAAAALFAGSGYYWYRNILTNPDRILNGMLDKSLQASGIQRSVSQQSGQSSVDQSVYLAFTPKTIAQSVTELQEAGTNGNTKVTTETLGTKDTDYVRYKSIEIPGGKNDKIDQILNVWGERKGDPEIGQSTSFLNDALLTAVPFGNLDQSQRAEVKDEVNKVKLYEYSKTETAFKSGRPVITYTIELDPQSLVRVLAKYVEVTNVGTSAELNPANYDGAEKIELRMEVDVLSRHLRSTEFVGSGRVETYSGYNAAKNVDTPDKTIGIDELQSRLSSLEQQQ